MGEFVGMGVLVGVAVNKLVGVRAGIGVGVGVWDGVGAGADDVSITSRVSEKPATSLTRIVWAPDAMPRKTCLRMPSE